MTAAVREQVLAEIAMRLAGVVGYTFFRNPNRPLIVDDMPALVQWDGGETVLDQFTGALQLRLTVSVEVYDASKDDGAALNEGFARAFEAVIPTGDTTLGGLAMNVRRGDMRDPETEQDEGKRLYRVLEFDFLVDYWTAESDPRALAPQ